MVTVGIHSETEMEGKSAMKKLTTLLVACMLGLSMAFVGCGKSEESNATESMQEAAEDMGDAMKDAAEEAGDKIEEATD